MNKLYTFLSLFLMTSALTAQENVTMNSGYANQVFYSFMNGEVSSEPANNWDIAFNTTAFGSSIRINGGFGVELYEHSTATDFDTADSTGISTWTPNRNSEVSWFGGAFDQNADEEFNLGWGEYNVITHIITGNRIFFLKTVEGNWKKIMIESLASGVYTFKYANIDGTELVETTLSKADYAGKNYGYYSLDSQTELDREPMSSEWDMVFTKYVAELAPNVHYGVTGVFTNAGVSVSQSDGVAVNNALWDDNPFSEDINTIGYDWKDLDQNFSYFIIEDRTYFVQTASGDVYQLTFTLFEGSSTGYIEFNAEFITNTSVHELTSSDVMVFPNPVNSGELLNITLPSEIRAAALKVTDLTGKSILHTDYTAENRLVNVSSLASGTYVLTITTPEQVVNTKFIIE